MTWENDSAEQTDCTVVIAGAGLQDQKAACRAAGGLDSRPPAPSASAPSASAPALTPAEVRPGHVLPADGAGTALGIIAIRTPSASARP